MTRSPPDFEAFLVVERPRLVAAMDLYLGDRYLAEEVVQEACIRAASRWSHVSRLESPGGWTYRVARNLATSWLRRRALERRTARRLADQRQPDEPDTAQHLAVRAAVAQLPEAQREAIVLRYFLGLDGAAIAERMGRSHGAVRALLKRGVAGLRADLGLAFVEDEEDADVR